MRADRVWATGSRCGAARLGGCPMPSVVRRRRPRSGTCSVCPDGRRPVVPYGGGTNVVGGLSPADLGPPRAEIHRSWSSTSSGWPASGLRSSRAASRRSVPASPARRSRQRSRPTAGCSATSRSRGSTRRSVAGSRRGRRASARSAFGRIEALFAGGHGWSRPPARSSCRPAPPRRPARTCARSCSARRAGWGSSTRGDGPRRSRSPSTNGTNAAVPARLGARAWRPSASWPAPGCRCRWSACRPRPRRGRPSPSPAGGAALGLAMRWVRRRGARRRPVSAAPRPGRPDADRRGDGRRGAKILRKHGAVTAPAAFGRGWDASRFRQPYLRNALWDAGYAVDTLETATDWSRAPGLAAALVQALDAGLEGENERVHAFAHLSHVYSSGTGIYVTYVFRQSPRPEGTHRRWLALKTAAQPGDRRARRHDQPPARRRARPRAVSRGREGRARAWRPCATSPPGSTPPA